jgi:hypothetical protein
MRRRDFVKFAGMAALNWPVATRAQFNSSRPITMIVPFPPGGGADVLVRILTKYMSDNLNQSIIVENQPGQEARWLLLTSPEQHRMATRWAGHPPDLPSWPQRCRI